MIKLSMMSYTLARGEWGETHDVAALCRLTRELDMDAIDWVTVYGHDPQEVRAITDDFGLRNVCHTFPARLQSPDPAERQSGLDAVAEGLETAAILGCDKVMVVISGLPGVPRDEARRHAIESLAKAVPMGLEAGIAVTIEHFPGADSPFLVSADVNTAIAAVPGLKVTFDNGNPVMGGENPADTYRNSREHIVHAHFKDFEVVEEDGRPGLDGRMYRPVLVGDGVVQPRPCLEAMKEGGYEGYINFEYEGSKYEAAEALRIGVPRLRDLMREVGVTG